MPTLAELQGTATSWNRPFTDLVALIRRIKEAYIKYPATYQQGERASFLGSSSNEQFERLKEMLVRDFIEQDLSSQIGGLVMYTCERCQPTRPWLADCILSNGKPQPPICPACCQPAKILRP